MWIKLFSRKVELLILLLSLTVIYGCSEDIGSKKSRAIIENPELKKVISKYLNKEVADKSFGEKPKEYATCAYKVLGVEQKEKKTTAYLWTFCKGKYLNENIPEYGSARPVSILIEKNQDNYRVSDIKVVDFPGRSPTIEEIFPPSIQKEIREKQFEYNRQLQEEMRK